MLTYGRLDAVQLPGDRGGQIGLQDFIDLREHFALIALRILLLHPQSDVDALLILGF